MPAYCPIIATLAYVMSEDRKSVLMINRNKRPDDAHYGKHNGLGGKVENNEDIVASVKREVFEEAGILCEKIVLRGTISWPGFGKGGEDWFGFIFRIDKFTGEVHSGNHEGVLEWIPLDQLDKLNLWESDRLWMDKVFLESTETFHGIAPFQDGKLLSWNFTTI